MSEFIINIIILLVIIISVLKRITEVNQKSRELGKERPGKQWGDLLEESKTGKPILDMSSEFGKIEKVSPAETPVLEEEPAMDYVIDETVPAERMIDVTEHRTGDILRETVFERLSAEDEFERLKSEEQELTKTLEKITSKKTRQKYSHAVSERFIPSVANLSFSRNNVVTGIVMSEILGPPVSMRHSEDTW